MTASSTPATANELIHFIGEFVRDRYAGTGQYTNGAALATAIRQKYPDFSYEQLGLTRLSDAITHAQREGIVTRQVGVKHLEVGPGPAFRAPAVLSDTAALPATRRYVRPDLWKAMLLFRPEQGHFFDRTTGRVITLPASSEDPDWVKTREANPSYVTIDPIPAEVQKEWMGEFVKTAKLDAAAAPINHEQWWRAFPEWLQAESSEHFRPWLAFRASQVIVYVQKWAEDNKLPAEAVFQTAARLAIRPTAGFDSVVPPHPPQPPHASEVALRNAVLAAIGDMTTHELLDVRVPVRSILRHFRPI